MKEGKPGRRQSLPENFHTAVHTGQWEASQDRVASMHNSSPEGLSSETPDMKNCPLTRPHLCQSPKGRSGGKNRTALIQGAIMGLAKKHGTREISRNPQR